MMHNDIIAKLQLIKNITTTIEISVMKEAISGVSWPSKKECMHIVSHWMRYKESEVPFLSW